MRLPLLGMTAPARQLLPRGLELRSRVSERRLHGLRRQGIRTGWRFAVLFTGDLLAVLAALGGLRLAALQLAAVSNFTELVEFGPLAGPGRPAGAIFVIALIAALPLTGSYGRHERFGVVLRIAGAVFVAGIATWVALGAVTGVGTAFLYVGVVSLASLLSLVLVRQLSEGFLRHVWPRGLGAAPAVLVGNQLPLDTDAARAIRALGGDYEVAAEYDLWQGRGDSDAAALRNLILSTQAEAVIVCDALPESQLRALLDTSLDCGCPLLYPPRAVQLQGVRPRLVWHGDHPFLELDAPALRVGAVITKRITDVVGSALVLLFALPLMAAIAVAVKLDSRGPVFFRQPRAGRGGRRFVMLKFRTMRVGADAEKQLLAHLNHTGDARLFKIPGDPRVTRTGSFLRRWSLDELPQMWNVLTGDMSLVGPRPFFESDFPDYEDHHFRRLDAKPGVTGLWQVSGRSELVNFDDVVFLDRQYIENWSFWLDLSIILRTIPAVVRRTGAY